MKQMTTRSNELTDETEIHSTPKVTVIVPIYTATASGIDYLRKALESLVSQSAADWKAYVLDDASPVSGIQDCVTSLGDSRLEYLRHEQNLDQAENWNTGKKMVDTQFFCILHADDELLPHYLATMTSYLEKHNDVAAAHCKALIINHEGHVSRSFVDFVKGFLNPHNRGLAKLSGEKGLSQLLLGNFIMCPTMMFRTAAVKGLNFSNEGRFIVDWEYWCRLLLHGHSILGVPEVCFRYRRHGASATAESRKADVVFRQELDFFRKMEALCLAEGFYEAAKVARAKRIVRLRAAYFLVFDLFSGRLSDCASKAKLLLESRH